jgi:hypothetical protein
MMQNQQDRSTVQLYSQCRYDDIEGLAVDSGSALCANLVRVDEVLESPKLAE